MSINWLLLNKLIEESFPFGQFEIMIFIRHLILKSCCYNPNKSMIGQHIETLSKSMNLHSSTYENFIF